MEKKKKNQSYLESLRELLEEEGITAQTINNLGSRPTEQPTQTITTSEEKKDRKWFQKGLFEDGYQFGDISKTILGTTDDAWKDLQAGAFGIVEGTIDAGAYLIGGVGGLFGAKGFQSKMEDFIEKDLIDEEAIAKSNWNPLNWNAVGLGSAMHLGGDSEDESVFGDKTDSLVQSGGQLAGQIGLQAVGVPWFVTSGVTSFGSQVEGALNEGASYGEAGLSGLVSAGADILTEKMFGGSGLGEKGLINLEPLTKGISNKVIKVLADYGVDVMAEGSEEVVASVISKFGESLYKEESLSELLMSEEAIDEYIESFIGGAALGGIMNSSNAYKSATSGRDYRTGLNTDEQTVVEKEVEKRIAEEEKNGKTLSKKEKDEIYDRVLKDLDKGYISIDTIEEALGGDTYKNYREVNDYDSSLIDKLGEMQKEFDTLNDMKDFDMTGKQRDRREELRSQIKELKASLEDEGRITNRTQLRSQLGEEVFNKAQNSRLIESYYEVHRRTQKYEADLSKYDAKQQAIIKKAIDSGILNNQRRTHEMVDFVAKLSADKGVLFDFTDNQKLKESGFAIDGKTVNGYVTKDGITLNINATKTLETIAGHEITHVLEGTELYNELQKAVFEYAKTKKEFDSRRKELAELYKNVKDADIDAELTADLVGDYLFADADFINNLSVNHRNVFQKIYDEIKYLCKIATAGSKEARELEKVKRTFEKVYKEGGKAKTVTDGSTEAETQYSISVTDKNTIDFLENQEHIVTYKSMQLIDGKLYPPMVAKVKGADGKYHLNNPSELGVWQQATEDPTNIKKIKNGVGYYTLNKGDGTSIDAAYNPYEHSSNLVLNDQFESAHRRDNLVTVECIIPVSEMTSGYKAQYAKDSTGVMDWKSGVVAGQIKDNKRQVYLSRYLKPVRILSEAETASKYKDILDGTGVSVPFNVVSPSLLAELEKAGVDIDYNGSPMYQSIQRRRAEKEAKKKEAKYSLSAEQQEYFKDSVVRDDNGNLKVMYHGTSKGGFNSFDTYGSNYGLFGLGSYFTDSKNIAESYTNKGKGQNKQVYETYLNITNPIDMDAQADAEAWKKAVPDAMFPESGTNEQFYRAMEEYLEDEMYSKWEAAEFAMDTLMGMGYDGITHIGGGRVNADGERHQVYIAFHPEQVKNIDNTKPTDSADIRYSLSADSQGRELTAEQKEYFKDSKIVDENGNLKVMYHGTPNGEYTVFKDGTYFTENKWYADLYQNPNASSISTGKKATAPKTFEVYLDIKKPFDLNDAEARNIYINDYIKGGNAVGINPYLSDAEYDKISSIDWTEGEDLREFLIDNGYDYDGLVLDEGAVGGYGEDVKYRGKSYVVFSPEQVKNIDNTVPTSDPDIRFSLSEADNTYMSAVERGDTETAQRMVDEVAEKSGYGIRAYHGSRSKFTVFDKNKGGKSNSNASIGFWFTQSKEGAKQFADDIWYGNTEETQVYDTYLKLNNPKVYKSVDNTKQIEELKSQFTDIDREMTLLDSTYGFEDGRRYHTERYDYDHSKRRRARYHDWKAFEAIVKKYDADSIDYFFSKVAEEDRQTVKQDGERYLELANIRKNYSNQLDNLRYSDSYEMFRTDIYSTIGKSAQDANIGGTGMYVENNDEMLKKYVDKLKSEGYDGIIIEDTEYDATVFDGKNNQYVVFDSSQIKSADPVTYDDNGNVIPLSERFNANSDDIRNSLSPLGKSPNHYGIETVENDVFAPIRKDIEPKKQKIAPLPSDAEPTNLYDIQELEREKEIIEQRYMKLVEEKQSIDTNDYDDAIEYLNSKYVALQERIDQLEAEENQRNSERLSSLTDEDAPTQLKAPYDGEETRAIPNDPFENRYWENVGSPKVQAYMDENPDAKPFYQYEANVLLEELGNTQKGERWYNADVAYEQGNEYGWGGTKRFTSSDIASLLDSGMSYANIEKGLGEIIEDKPKKSASAKRIELYIHDRLMKGYTSFPDNVKINRNQAYIDLLNGQQMNEEYAESFDNYMQSLDKLAPLPVKEEIKAPIRSEAIKPMPEKLTGEEAQWAKNKMARVSNTKQIAKSLTEEPTTNKKKQSAISKFLNHLVDNATPFETLSLKRGNRELDAKFNFMRYSESKAQTMIGEGDADKGIRSLKSIREEVEKSGLTEQFYDYLHHQHNVDRMSLRKIAKAKANQMLKETPLLAELSRRNTIEDIVSKIDENTSQVVFDEIVNQELSKQKTDLFKSDKIELSQDLLNKVKQLVKLEATRNKPVFGWSVTANKSRQAIAQLETQYPQFKRLAQDVYKYNNNLRQMLVDGGVISKETAKLWQEMYPHYVPIRRVGDEGLNVNVPLDTNRTGVNAPIKRATGGNRDILPLFDTMAQRTIQTYKAIAKNRFGVELKNTLGTTIDSQKTNLDEVLNGVDAHEELLQKGKDGRNPTFTVFENGERVTFEITEAMYDALKPTNDLFRGTNKVLNWATNAFRGLTTEYNPAFLLTNVTKDIQDILMNSQHAPQTYAKIPEAAKQLLTNSGKYVKEYLSNGGEDLTYFDGKTNKFTQDKSGIRKLVGMPLDAIAKANNFFERIPRLAEYIASREAGASIEVAMLDAARVTTNFSAGGDVTKWANRNGATFLNASVQGFAQQVRNIREAKYKGLQGWLGLATKFTIAGLSAEVLNHLLWEDDEEYEELSDYVKDNYYVVAKYGDGKFIRIPKGRTVAVIQDAFEQVKNQLTGDDEADWQNFFQLFMNNIAPNNPIENNVFAPIIQTANNKTWYGEDLVPSRLQDLPKAEQYDESTDMFSRWLGETFNVSPYKANYLINQYSGGIGDMLLPMLTPEAESGDNSLAGNLLAPIKDKFTTDSTMNNQNVADFYDVKDQLTTNAKASGATDEDILKSKYMNSINSELSDLYAEKREIQNSYMDDDEKYQAVKDIQQQIVDLTRNSLSNYDRVSMSGDYARVGNKYFRKNDSGEWVKLTNKQIEQQEEVTESLKIDPAEYWSNKSEYDFAYEHPEKYAVAKSVGGYDAYKQYSSELYDIKADKDSSGKSINGSRKKKVIEYVNSLDIDYGARLIIFKSEYNADDTYNYEIIDYLNSRDDITYEEMNSICKELGFTVHSDGRITW